MKSILLPVNMILRIPREQPQFGEFVEVTGWADCFLDPALARDGESVQFSLTLVLAIKGTGGNGSLGNIAVDSSDQGVFSTAGTVLLERTFAVSGDLKGLALRVVFRMAENQVDIVHVRFAAEGDEGVE